VLDRTRRALAGPAIMAYNLVLLALCDRTPFPDMAQFPFSRHLEENWRAIRDEADDLLEQGVEIPSYFENDPGQRQFWAMVDRLVGRVRPVANPGSANLDRWQTFVFRTYGKDVIANLTRCPETARALSEIPGLSGAQFSILNPGVTIPRHFGLFPGALRMHLGLRVPPGKRTAIEVGGQQRAWHEGEVFVFEHSRWHSAWNLSDEARIILILDFERPMRWSWLEKLNHRVVVWLRHSSRAQETVDSIERLGPGVNSA